MMMELMFFLGVFILVYFKDWILILNLIFLNWVLFLSALMSWNDFLGNIMISYFFSLDLLSMNLILLSVWLGGLMIISMYKIFNLNFYSVEFLLLSLLLILFLLTSFLSMDLLMFYFSFESVLIPMLIMLMGYGFQPERLNAGVYMLFYTVFGSLPLLLMLLYLKNLFVSLNYLYMYMILELSVGWMWVGLILAFMIKLPVFGFHQWLPKAHVEAPVSGSMILAGVLLKLGGYGFYRILPLILVEFVNYNNYLISLGLMGGLMSSLICFRQTDMKLLVAYSSVGHMGLFISGLGTLSVLGFSGGLIMMVAHGITSSGLFSLVNMIYERFHSRSMLLVRGLLMIFPSLAFFMFLLSISNMAAPPFLNLFGEIMLGVGLMNWSELNFFVLGLMFFVAASYSLYFYSMTQHGVSWGGGGFKLILLSEYLLLILHLFPLFILIFFLGIF